MAPDDTSAASLYPSMSQPAPAPAPAKPATDQPQTRDDFAAEFYGATTKAQVERPRAPHPADDIYPSLAPKKAEAPADAKAPADAAKPEDGKPADAADERTPEQIAEATEALRTELADVLDTATPEVGNAFTKFAAEKNLSADDAKQLADMQSQHSSEYWQKLNEGWIAEAEASPTFEADAAGARDLVAEHGTPELTQLLNQFYVGNNPHVIAFLGKVSRALKGKS